MPNAQQVNDASPPRLCDCPSICTGQASTAQHCQVHPGTWEPPEAAGAGIRSGSSRKVSSDGRASSPQMH